MVSSGDATDGQVVLHGTKGIFQPKERNAFFKFVHTQRKVT